MTWEVKLQFSTTVDAWANRWSWVIRHMCHSPFSHVDFLMPDGSLLGASDSPAAPVLKGNSRGVAIRPNDYEVYGYRRSMTIETPLSEQIMAAALSQLGKPFDNSALKGFLSDAPPGKRNPMDNASWFCSELVIWSFETAGYWYPRPSVWPKNRISPSDILMLFLFDPNWTNRDSFWENLPPPEKTAGKTAEL